MHFGSISILLAAVASGVSAAPSAPLRDYFPDWRTSSSLAEQRNVRVEGKSSVTVSRLVPDQPYLLTEVAMLGRSSVPAGTILIPIETRPFTACEMARPKGHESFACFVDGDGDGRFDGTYRLTSHSFFLLAAWSNRSPTPMAPVRFRRVDVNQLSDHIDLVLARVRSLGFGKRSLYTVRAESRQRADFWVNAGQLIIGSDDVGRRFTIRGSTVIIRSADGNGVTVDVIPPSTPLQTRFTIQKNMYKNEGSAIIPWE